MIPWEDEFDLIQHLLDVIKLPLDLHDLVSYLKGQDNPSDIHQNRESHAVLVTQRRPQHLDPCRHVLGEQ